VKKIERLIEGYARGLRIAVMALAAVTNAGIMAMVLITCTDIVLRLIGHPIIGAYDLVRVAGAISMACALPYVTAVKGHVAIEYFFQKMNLLGRNIVDRVLNLVGITLFSMLANESFRSGTKMKVRGEVTATLQLPMFWVLWLVAVCCFMVALVIFYNLLQPRKELIRP
jgi:TRAP-type C4-dicarboxylate transport system permease small subunit